MFLNKVSLFLLSYVTKQDLQKGLLFFFFNFFFKKMNLIVNPKEDKKRV